MATRQAELVLRHVRALLSRQGGEGRSDSELLRRFCRERDEDAFAELVRRHGAMVLAACRRVLPNPHDADDVFQAAFLVLARKANSRGWRESVGNWLYLVAYRLALRVREETRRRVRYEARAAVAAPADPLEAVTGRELSVALDEELSRLPQHYRAGIVACCLEGQTRDEAARALGWSPRLLKRRLERGRALLRARLEKRGFTLPTSLAGALVAEGVSPAVVPDSLFQTVVTTGASRVASSARVLELSQTLVRGEFLWRLRAAAVVFLAASLIGGVGLGFSLQSEEKAHRSLQAVKARIEEQRTDLYGDPLAPEAIARFGTLRFRHGPRVNRAVLSLDGKLIATGDMDCICLWDAATGKELHRWPSVGTLLDFSPDGKLLAVNTNDTAPRNKKLRILNAATGKEVHQLTVHQAWVSAAVFAPDGKTLASCMDDKIVHLWNTATGQELRRLEGHQEKVSTLAFSSDSRTLASGSADQTICLWDVATGNERIRLTGHEGAVRAIAFGPGGATLATGGDDRAIRLWDVGMRKQVRVLGRHANAVVAVAFSPDGKLLASGGSFDTIALWDVAAGKELRRWETPDVQILVGFFRDGKTLATVPFLECGPRFWDVATGREIGPARGHRSPVDWIAFAPDGKSLSSSEREQMRLLRWDLATGRERETFSLPPRRLTHLIRSSLSPDGKTLATWELSDRIEGAVRVRDPATGQELHLLGQHKWENSSGKTVAPNRPLDFSTDSKQLASVDHERIVLWDVATGRKVRDFRGLEGEIQCVALAPDGRTVAAGILDEKGIRSIFLWEVATGKEPRAFGHEKEQVRFLAFSPDGKLLVSAGGSSKVRLWEVATGRERLALTDLKGELFALAFSPDGKLLAGSDWWKDNGICLWDVETGEELRKLTGHRGKANALVFTPDGKTLISGGDDTTILLWDVAGVTRRGRPEVRLTPQEWDALWKELVGTDAAQAHQAIAKLTASPRTVAALKERLHPAPKIDADRLEQLLRDLDSESFNVREKATKEIEKFGEGARPAIERALASTDASPEKRRRLERLQSRLGVPTGEPLRELRALEVLERLATPEAKQIIEKLANGAPDARLTREAKAALVRLKKRQ